MLTSSSWQDVDVDPLSLLVAEPAAVGAPAAELPPKRASSLVVAGQFTELETQTAPFSSAIWRASSASTVTTPTAEATKQPMTTEPGDVWAGDEWADLSHAHVGRARRSLQEPLRHAAAEQPAHPAALAAATATEARSSEEGSEAPMAEAPACDADVLIGLPVWTPEAASPPRATAECVATRYRVLPSGLPDFSVIPVEGRLRGTPDGTLTHVADLEVATGQPIHGPDSMTWRAKTADLSMAAAPSSVRWLHESHPAVEPLICSGRLICADADEGLPAWLVEERVGTALSPSERPPQPSGDASPIVYVVCFRSMSDALRVEIALGDCVEMAWSAEVAAAMADGARIFGQSVRGAAESLREQVRWAADYFVESVEGTDDRSAPVCEEVRDAMKVGRLALGELAEMGLSVAGGVSSYAYFAGKEVAEAAEAAGVLAAFDTPAGRACAQVNGAVLRAASDLVTDLGDSAHAVMGESAEAITKAVKHTQGDAAAEVADDALSGAANVRDVVFSVAPVSLVKRAAFASALGAAGMEEELAALTAQQGAATASPQGPGDQGNALELAKESSGASAPSVASHWCSPAKGKAEDVSVCDEASGGWESLGVACESGTAEPSGGVGRSWDGTSGITAASDRVVALAPQAQLRQHEQPVFVPVD